MVGDCCQQLRSGLDAVLAGLCNLHKLREIVDELPQFFIHVADPTSGGHHHAAAGDGAEAGRCPHPF
jgi:hypothetical protein